MPHPAGSQLLDVPLPDGIGVEDPGHPLPPQLVGTLDQLATLGDRIRRAVGALRSVAIGDVDQVLTGKLPHPELAPIVAECRAVAALSLCQPATLDALTAWTESTP